MSTIENLGDAYEAIEEMWMMIQHLTSGDKVKIHEAWREGYLRSVCPSNLTDPCSSYKRFWSDE
jgi:hypothetical protein